MSKTENNSLSKSLEALEKDYWKNDDSESHLIKTCHALRKKQLKDFEIEDLRIMIGQDIGLKYLIPLAIVQLENNIFAEGDFYEGDLLKAVLTSDIDYWKEHAENWKTVCELFERNAEILKREAFESDALRQVLKAFKVFNQIN